MNKQFNWLTAATAVVALSMAGNVFATNGYFTHGTGTKNKAMAGAGIAMPEDSIDVTNNPAVAPFVGELATLLDIPQSPLSQHLARMRKEKLVITRREAQTIYYSIASREAAEFVALMHDLYCNDD